MSTHQVSNPRLANQSITDESGRPGTCRSKVGCEAIDEPWTNSTVPALPVGSPTYFSQRKSLMSAFLVQCSRPTTGPDNNVSVISLVLLIERLNATKNAARRRVDDDADGVAHRQALRGM